MPFVNEDLNIGTLAEDFQHERSSRMLLSKSCLSGSIGTFEMMKKCHQSSENLDKQHISQTTITGYSTERIQLRMNMSANLVY